MTRDVVRFFRCQCGALTPWPDGDVAPPCAACSRTCRECGDLEPSGICEQCVQANARSLADFARWEAL